MGWTQEWFDVREMVGMVGTGYQELKSFNPTSVILKYKLYNLCVSKVDFGDWDGMIRYVPALCFKNIINGTYLRIMKGVFNGMEYFPLKPKRA